MPIRLEALQMAAKRKPADPLAELPTQDEIDLDTFLDEIGPRASIVEVFEMRRDGSRPHLDRVTMDTIQEDVYGYLRNLNGSGKYLLLFKGSDRRVQTSKVVEVSRGGGPAGPAIAPTVHPVQTPAAATNGTDPVVLLLREQLAQQQAMLTTLMASMKGPDLTPLVAAMNANRSDPAAMLGAVVAAFTALKDTNADNSDWVGKAKNVLQLAKELQSGGESSEGWSVVREAIPMVTAAIAGGGQPGAQSPIAPPGNPNGHADAQVRAGLAYLKPKILAGMMPVELAFDWIRFNMDNPQWRPLVEKAVNKGLPGIIEFDPELGNEPYKTWFGKLVTMIETQIKQENEGDEQT